MSKNSIIQKVEQPQLKTNVPDFSPGDTILVQVRIKEGERERLQAYEGVVIGKRNRGLNSAFTVRKMSHGVGVERTFQTHSHLVESITVKRRGDVRQAKLYYLRDLTGRAARIAEKLGKKGEKAKTPLDDTTTIAEQIEAAQDEDLLTDDNTEESASEEVVAETVDTTESEKASGEMTEEVTGKVAEEAPQAEAEDTASASADEVEQEKTKEEKKEKKEKKENKKED